MLMLVYFETFFLVHFYISEERVDMVTQQFEEFNKHFREIESVFKEVTGVDFVFGQKFMDVDKQVRIYIWFCHFSMKGDDMVLEM